MGTRTLVCMPSHRVRLLNAKVVCALIIGLGATISLPAEDPDAVTITYFWGEGCPACERQNSFLNDLSAAYPELTIERFEVWNDPEDREFFQNVGEELGFEAGPVPTTVIGERYWIGFTQQYEREIVSTVEECFRNECPEPGPDSKGRGSRDELVLPLLGRIDPASVAPALSTMLIAGVDGFNPCSLWVLTMLFALVAYAGSRAKTAVVGTTFLAVTAIVYGAFIAGVFTVLTLVERLGWIRLVTAVPAFLFGALSIREYFAASGRLRTTLSAQQKRSIAGRMRVALTGKRSLAATVGATVLIAAGVAVAELPCTAGFPVVWSGLMAQQGVSGPAFGALLVLYVLVYLLLELVVFTAAVYGLGIRRFTEGYGRIIKLVGGTLMLVLAVALVALPEALTNPARTLKLFSIGVGGAILIALVRARLISSRQKNPTSGEL